MAPGPRTVRATSLALVISVGMMISSLSVAQAPLSADEVVLEDTIAVELIGREVVAFDLEGSGRLIERLELDEEVLFTGSRGRVAVVLTNRRALASTPTSSSWQTERYHLAETPPDYALLSQGLALVVTHKRALAFFGSGNWAEKSLGPRERFLDARVGPGVAVVVTDRRGLGISSTGGFFETKLRVNEVVESVRAVSSIATILTSQRTLLFKGPISRWIEHRRPLR